MSRSPRQGVTSKSIQSIRIEAPRYQNWSCHGCTNCCRGSLLIEISEEEKRRIQSQGWTAAEGVDPQNMIVTEGGRNRLGHQSDGACVFLDVSGRCRIHARFGEAAKPLPCRLYPLAIHPAGEKLVVSLRYDCPSAAENRGTPLADQLPEIRRLAELVVPAAYKAAPAPAVLQEPGLAWDDFSRYVNWLDRTLSPVDVPIALKICRALHWLKAVAGAHFDQLTGSGADEILEALVRSSAEKLGALPTNCAPSGFAKFCLRHLVLEAGRTATTQDASLGSAYRWKKLWALLRFASAFGQVPAIGNETRKIRFSDIERSFGPLPSGAEAILTRYCRVKVNGLHFCGPAYHGFALVEGFYSLALAFAAILWLSRYRAAAEGRASLSDADVARALSMVDHQHGYSQSFSNQALRRRIRLLAQRDDIAKLCCWHVG